MNDKKQSKAEQRRWHKLCLLLKEHWHRILLGVLVIVISYCICSPYLSPERRATNNDHTHLVRYLIGLAVTGAVVLCIPQIITANPKKYFITRVLTTGITGGAFALLLPIAVKSTTTGVGGLRHSILLATGGLLAILTLGETRRKNDIDKRKNEQEKEKNDKDHRRQVRAERRERYTKAVEQLGDEKAPIRMGGVYTLVGLVDEWLKDESKKYEDRLKEGQVIVNNLCAYIRSPFILASYYDELSEDNPSSDGIYKDNQQKFYTDKAEFKAEADVRLGIIKEIHSRLRGAEINTPREWSDFEYDFSGSAFFYPIDLTNSYYTKSVNFSGSTYSEKADFSGSTYQGGADFGGSTYKGKASFGKSTYEKKVIFSTSNSRSTYKGKADFSGSTYRGDWVNFSGSTYEKNVIFSTSASRSTYEGQTNFDGSTYKGKASFGESTYEKNVIFSTFASRSTYEGRTDFGGSTYEGRAEFGDSTYEKDATFSTSGFPSTYRGGVTFSGSTYKDEAKFGGSIYEKDATFSTSISPSTYRGGVTFSGSTYQGEANFSRSTYEEYVIAFKSTYWGKANFSGSIYRGDWVNFSGSTYQGKADFSGSIFYQKVYFGADGANGSFSRFIGCAPQFYDETYRKNTLFGSPDNNFTVENGRGYPIYRNLEGLPLGCKFLTSDQKEYLADKFQEIEKINNKLREVKDTEEKANLIKTLLSFHYGIRNWHWEATTVKVEDVAAEDTES